MHFLLIFFSSLLLKYLVSKDLSVILSVSVKMSAIMINVKFYLDKADKNRLFPIHLVIRKKDAQIKVATGEKIKKKD